MVWSALAHCHKAVWTHSRSWGAGQQGDGPGGDGIRRVELALCGRLRRKPGKATRGCVAAVVLTAKSASSVRPSAAFACSHSACAFATDSRPWRGEAPRSSVVMDDPRRVELLRLFYLERDGPQHQERRDLSACSRTGAADWRIHDRCDHGRVASAAGARTTQARCSGSCSKTPRDCRTMCESHGTGASFGGARGHAL